MSDDLETGGCIDEMCLAFTEAGGVLLVGKNQEATVDDVATEKHVESGKKESSSSTLYEQLLSEWPIYLDLVEAVIAGAFNEESSLTLIGYCALFDLLYFFVVDQTRLYQCKNSEMLGSLNSIAFPPEPTITDEKKALHRGYKPGFGSIYLMVSLIYEVGQATAFASLTRYNATFSIVFYALAAVQWYYNMRSFYDELDKQKSYSSWVVGAWQKSHITQSSLPMLFDLVTVFLVIVGEPPVWYDIILTVAMWAVSVRPTPYCEMPVNGDSALASQLISHQNNAFASKLQTKVVEKRIVDVFGHCVFPFQSASERFYSPQILVALHLYAAAIVVHAISMDGVSSTLSIVASPFILGYIVACDYSTIVYHIFETEDKVRECYDELMKDAEYNDEGRLTFKLSEDECLNGVYPIDLSWADKHTCGHLIKHLTPEGYDLYLSMKISDSTRCAVVADSWKTSVAAGADFDRINCAENPTIDELLQCTDATKYPSSDLYFIQCKSCQRLTHAKAVNA